jgi:hypothetical protein
MDLWKSLQNEFNGLMEEEDRIVQQRELSDRCYAYVTEPESGRGDGWLECITTENLQVRFERLGTEAGIVLGSPQGTVPLTYWLHRLFLDLRAHNSPLIRVQSDTGGIIEHLFEASAIYCARLDRQSLEKAAISREVGESVAGPRGLCETPQGRDLDSAQSDPIGDASSKAKDAAIGGRGLSPVRDAHLDLLEMILDKRATTLEKWASQHKLGRTTVFDWKSGRSAGKSLKGKVSVEKSTQIEETIQADAATLGLTTRTDSD